MVVDKVPVLFAGSDPRRHPCVAQLSAHPLVGGVRACRDLSDLLTFAATGGAGVAFVELAYLDELDRSAVAAVERHGVRVVGLADAADVAGHERLGRLGVGTRLVTRAGRCDPASLDEALRAKLLLVRDGQAGRGTRVNASMSQPRSTAPPLPSSRWQETTLDLLLGESGTFGSGTAGPRTPGTGLRGPIVAVWGPTGAPGRSTIAAALAREFAESGLSTLLVDADPYGGALALRLGLLDEASTLTAAVRLADAGHLDESRVEELAAHLPNNVRVLTGITDPARWPQLRPAGLDAVLHLAGDAYDRVVVDCGFCLEQDEELSYDTAAPRRNGATLAALARADDLVVVGTADPVGAARLEAGLRELAQLVPDAATWVLLNRIDGQGRRARAGRQLARRLRTSDPRLAVLLLPTDADPGGKGPLRQALASFVHDPGPSRG